MAQPLTLILGGARSGKSAHAEALMAGFAPPWTYIATAQAFDDEMMERIALHRARRDSRWNTVDAPIDMPSALRAADAPVLVDCLTLWLTNLILSDHDLEAAFTDFDAAIAAVRHPVFLVGNEVGLGIVPDNALARRFRDEAGRLHQRLARRADRVLFMVAGLPMVVK